MRTLRCSVPPSLALSRFRTFCTVSILTGKRLSLSLVLNSGHISFQFLMRGWLFCFASSLSLCALFSLLDQMFEKCLGALKHDDIFVSVNAPLCFCTCQLRTIRSTFCKLTWVNEKLFSHTISFLHHPHDRVLTLGVARTFFCPILLPWRTDIACTHGSQYLQCACHISPSHPLSLLMNELYFGLMDRKHS